MNRLIGWLNCAQGLLDRVLKADVVCSVLLRAYLVPVFWVAGNNKWNPFNSGSSLDNVIDWFGNPDWGLGLPFPALNAYLAWGAEYFGAILLALGLATRWICIPLMITMVVAAVTVHWGHGWQAVHDPMSPFASSNAQMAIEQLREARHILNEQMDFMWMSKHGRLVVSNNGIEWSATYFLMLMALFFLGAGRWLSLDYWIARRFRRGVRNNASG